MGRIEWCNLGLLSGEGALILLSGRGVGDSIIIFSGGRGVYDLFMTKGCLGLLSGKWCLGRLSRKGWRTCV